MGNEPFIIDRLTALDLFEAMVCGDTSHRILRIAGGAKMGKSHLLREFNRRARFEHDLSLAAVELGEQLTDVQSILLSLKNQLISFRFDNYAEAIKSQPNAQSEIQDAKFFLSKVSVNVEAQQNEAEKRRQFTVAFLEDLKANQNQKLFLCIDTIDQAENLHGWLQDEFLSGICQLENIFVVVAGRFLPKTPMSLEWHCQDHSLEPFEIKHYKEAREKLELDLDDEKVALLHKVFEGKPGPLFEAAPRLRGG